MFQKNSIYYILGVLLLASCASYEPQYRHPDKIPVYPSEKEIEKTFYLIGDAGYSKPGGMSKGLQVVQNFLKTQKTSGNYAIFLGDNIYPDGMPPQGAPGRKNAEHRLDAQYQAVKDYDGQVIFIPGNHDWYSEGLLGLKRQELYFESKIKDRKVFKPNNGCPLESIEVTENVQLLLVDTQWYLEDWDIHPSINEFCDIKTREKFFIEIGLELEKHQDKTIVFAMHHPMFTNGNHGGYFAAQKHLYPTQKKLPLPILASLVAQIRSQGGVSVQDRYNELYNKLMIRLGTIAKNNDRIVFASGHEHTLQHIERDGLTQIVSGSGAKSSFSSLGNDGLFSYGGQGFAVMDVFTDGSSWVRYYGGDDNYNPVLLYEKELFPPRKTYDTSNLPTVFPEEVETSIYTQDSIREAVFFRTVWGAKYKDAYSTRIKANVGRLDSLFGGVEVIKEDGANDYKALRLRDADGNEYRMRALRKNALQYTRQIAEVKNTKEETESATEETTITLPDNFDVNFYTASHPYAVMAVPKMADAVNIFYTRPRLFYIPKQERLGVYNEKYGDELYFVSIEPNEDSEGERTFQYPDDIETTDDILIKLRQQGEIFVDEGNYIKSRLFDMLIGDWDRETDHWRWAEFYNLDSLNVYVPIPKNRDDAFSSFEGNIVDLARSIFGSSNQKHVYDEKLTDIAWFNKEGIILDRALLKRSGRQQWMYQAKFLQEQISDALISEAFNEIPEAVRDASLEEIIERLKKRRDNLTDIADRYYTFLSTLQTITATDNNDIIEITRLSEGRTQVAVFKIEDGKKAEQTIDRIYKSSDTRELWIYGLDGKDIISVSGEESDDLIFLRLIGGQEKDLYRIHSGKRVKVYDQESRPNEVEVKQGGTLRFTDVYTLNTYDFRKQIDKDNNIAAAIGFNPDDGFRTGLQYVYKLNGFQRNPFSQQHVINAGYYFDTSSFDIEYNGEFANIQDDLNLSIEARITSPNYTVNYFGYGNETQNFQDLAGVGFEANRLELQTISTALGLLRNSNFGSFFKVQLKGEAITINSPITGRVNATNTSRPEDTDYFGTLEAIYSYRSFDNARNPTRGMLFDLNIGAKDNLQDLDRYFGFLSTRLGFYNALNATNKLVLRTNVRAKFNFGNRFEFYQGVQLGGETGLRGFREERFTGKSALVGNADIRYSFNEFNIELIPIQIGIYAGGDLGRVWIPSRLSEKWHNSYGGGLWVNGSGDLGATFSAFRSSEGTRYSFGVGFTF
ncbi:metallophosphoesterase [Candidatus Ulvibacter alkanivorans]|uniref:metallophosphoesterase n=1 Tax=Candidatus Ulvibacter alkanivorans TaxID=2267620 RepID=UPI000DF35F79|nr:metallophosphoesterase [Candidatus Ulvibacter alkanivorans]